MTAISAGKGGGHKSCPTIALREQLLGVKAFTSTSG
jgi:hypothetical protein